MKISLLAEPHQIYLKTQMNRNYPTVPMTAHVEDTSSAALPELRAPRSEAKFILTYTSSLLTGHNSQ